MDLYADAFAGCYAAPHNFRMDYPRIVKAVLEAGDMTQAQLAKRLKVQQPTISRWLRGTKPDKAQHDRIVAEAHRLGLVGDIRSEDVAAALPSRAPARTVKLKGYVGAGGQAHYYALSDEDFEEVPAPEGATDQTVAVEIKGGSLGPLLESWLVYYQDVRSPVEADLIGRLCVVGLADDRILVKKIQSNGRGGFTLISNAAEPPIENAAIEWAALVTDLKPRR